MYPYENIHSSHSIGTCDYCGGEMNVEQHVLMVKSTNDRIHDYCWEDYCIDMADELTEPVEYH